MTNDCFFNSTYVNHLFRGHPIGEMLRNGLGLSISLLQKWLTFSRKVEAESFLNGS